MSAQVVVAAQPQVDFSGTWTMHMHGPLDSPVIWYDYDAVLTGPPGGPWRIVTTLRHSTFPQSPVSEQVGRVDSTCMIWLTGRQAIERRCLIPPNYRRPGEAAEVVQRGSIDGDQLALLPMTGIPAMTYGEMRRVSYAQPARQPASNPGTAISPGTWRWSATCGGSQYVGSFTVALQPDNTFYGQFTQDGAPAVNGTIAGRIQGANIVFNRRWSSPGEQQWSGTLDQSGAAMRGNVTGYNGPCTFSATKSSAEMPRGAYPQPPSQPATTPATWRWSATCGGSSYTGRFTVAVQPDSTFYGQFTQDGTPDVYNGTIAGRLRAPSIVFTRRWGNPGEQQWSGTLDQSGATMRGGVTGYNGPCTFSATKS